MRLSVRKPFQRWAPPGSRCKPDGRHRNCCRMNPVRRLQPVLVRDAGDARPYPRAPSTASRRIQYIRHAATAWISMPPAHFRRRAGATATSIQQRIFWTGWTYVQCVKVVADSQSFREYAFRLQGDAIYSVLSHESAPLIWISRIFDARTLPANGTRAVPTGQARTEFSSQK